MVVLNMYGVSGDGTYVTLNPTRGVIGAVIHWTCAYQVLDQRRLQSISVGVLHSSWYVCYLSPCGYQLLIRPFLVAYFALGISAFCIGIASSRSLSEEVRVPPK